MTELPISFLDNVLLKHSPPPQPSIEALNKRILRRLPRLDVMPIWRGPIMVRTQIFSKSLLYKSFLSRSDSTGKWRSFRASSQLKKLEDTSSMAILRYPKNTQYYGSADSRV